MSILCGRGTRSVGLTLLVRGLSLVCATFALSGFVVAPLVLPSRALAEGAGINRLWPDRSVRGPELSADGSLLYVQAIGGALTLSPRRSRTARQAGFWFTARRRPSGSRPVVAYAIGVDRPGRAPDPLGGGIAGLFPQVAADGPLVGFDAGQLEGFPDTFESSALATRTGPLLFGHDFLPPVKPNWNLHNALLTGALSSTRGLVVERAQDPLGPDVTLPGYGPGDLIWSEAGTLRLVEQDVCATPNGGRGPSTWSARVRPPATIAGDGRHAFFCSQTRDATDTAAGPVALGRRDPVTAFESHWIYRKDLVSGVVDVVNVGPTGRVIANPKGFLNSVSADGNVAVFESRARGRSTGSTDSLSHLYARDFRRSTTARLDKAIGTSGKRRDGSHAAQVSADGRFVVFESDLRLRGTGRGLGRAVYLVDLASHSLVRVNSGSGESFEPTISADGKRVAFVTTAGAQHDARHRPITRVIVKANPLRTNGH